MPFLKANLQTVNIVIWVAHHAPERLGEFTAHLKQRHHKALSDHLRTHIKDSMDLLIQTSDSEMLEPVARWVLRQGPEEDTLRWSLINDERLKVIERSKLLERLIGRAHEPDIIKRAETLLSTTEEELLRVAARTYQPPHLNFPMSTQSSGLASLPTPPVVPSTISKQALISKGRLPQPALCSVSPDGFLGPTFSVNPSSTCLIFQRAMSKDGR